MNPALIPGVEYGDPRREPGPEVVKGVPTKVWASHESVRVGEYEMPLSIVLVAEPDDDRPAVAIHATVVEGHPRITQICHHGDVHRKDLDSLRLNAVTEAFAQLSITFEVVKVLPGGLAVRKVVGGDAVEPVLAEGRRRRRITPELLAEVAQVYRDNIRRAPTKAVRHHFSVSERQASKYVAEARQAGLLPETTVGKKQA